jgi:hypothetical protein
VAKGNRTHDYKALLPKTYTEAWIINHKPASWVPERTSNRTAKHCLLDPIMQDSMRSTHHGTDQWLPCCDADGQMGLNTPFPVPEPPQDSLATEVARGNLHSSLYRVHGVLFTATIDQCHWTAVIKHHIHSVGHAHKPIENHILLIYDTCEWHLPRTGMCHKVLYIRKLT